MATVGATRMTVEEFLALPDDGIERMLIDGEVRGPETTVCGWRHAAVIANIIHVLRGWVRGRPRPRGRVVGAEARFCLAPATLIGADVACVSPELAAATTDRHPYFTGGPALAAEVPAPSDLIGDTEDKVAAYLEAAVPHVWVVNTAFRTITLYQPDSTPRLYTISDEIDAEPHLPGFRAAVATIFED